MVKDCHPNGEMKWLPQLHYMLGEGVTRPVAAQLKGNECVCLEQRLGLLHSAAPVMWEGHSSHRKEGERQIRKPAQRTASGERERGAAGPARTGVLLAVPLGCGSVAQKQCWVIVNNLKSLWGDFY